MPANERPGKRTLYCELPEDVFRLLHHAAFERRQSKTDLVIDLIRHGLDKIPDPEPKQAPPLDDVPKKRGRPKRKEK